MKVKYEIKKIIAAKAQGLIPSISPAVIIVQIPNDLNIPEISNWRGLAETGAFLFSKCPFSKAENKSFSFKKKLSL